MTFQENANPTLCMTCTGVLIASILAGAALSVAGIWVDGQARHALTWTGILVGLCGFFYSVTAIGMTPPGRRVNPVWTIMVIPATLGVGLGVAGLWDPDRFHELVWLAVVASVPGSLTAYGLVLVSRKRSPFGGVVMFAVMLTAGLVLVAAIYADGEMMGRLFWTAIVVGVVGGGFSLVIAGQDRDQPE